MATGRTTSNFYRLYVDGYDLSGWGRSIGPINIEHEEADFTVWTDTVRGYLKNQSNVNIGVFNGIFDNTASTGSWDLLKVAGGYRNVLIALGIQAAPAQGDPAFMGQFVHGAARAVDDGRVLTVHADFDNWSSQGGNLQIAPGWGQLLHANAAETAINSGIGIDNEAQAVSTLNGGIFMYQVLAGNGTATIKVQDAATNTNPSFADLAGATSGSITCAAGVSGLIATAPTATVRRYLRWQIALGTATSVTFLAAFARAW